jgi:membrane protease YdiL (CAAX protease family)
MCRARPVCRSHDPFEPWLQPAPRLGAHREPPAHLAAVVAVVLLLAVWAVGVIQGGSASPDLSQGALAVVQSDWAGYLGLPTFLMMWALVWIFVRLWEQRPFRTIGLQLRSSLARSPLSLWLRGAGLGALMLGIAVVGLAALGLLELRPAPAFSAIGWLVPSLAFFLIQGAAEEVVHRGYLLPVTAARAGPLLGVLLSSVLFALLHALNPGLSALGLLNLLLSGVFLAILALQQGNLWVVFGWHTTWNWVQGPLLGLPVSGDASWAAHSFLDLAAADAAPAWLAGGSFGPEGGLAVTTVLALGTLALLLGHRRRLTGSGQS